MDRDRVKFIVRLFTEAGAGYIAKELIKGNVTSPTRIDKKIAYLLGAFALAGYVANKAGRYTDVLIDEIYDAYAKVMKELQK